MGVGEFLEEKPAAAIALLFVVSLIVRLAVCFLYFTPEAGLWGDQMFYYIKATQIANGDFSPMLMFPYGWSFVIAPVFFLFGSGDFLANQSYMRLVSVVAGSLIIIPYYFLAKMSLKGRARTVALLMFPFTLNLVLPAVLAGVEPIFTFFFLAALCFTGYSSKKPVYAIFASILAAACSYIRHNGIFVEAIVLTSLAYFMWKSWREGNEWKSRLWILAVSCIAFLLAVTPLYYERYLYFGSPFDFGETSMYWVDDIHKLSSRNLPVPTAWDYFSTHTPWQILDKFLVSGLLNMLYVLAFYTLTIVFFPFFVWGILEKKRDVHVMFLIAIALWMLHQLPFWYPIGQTNRYFFPFVPLMLIFTAKGVDSAFARFKIPLAWFMASFILINLLIFPLYYAPIFNQNNEFYRDSAVWGRALADKVRGGEIQGKIAIFFGEPILAQFKDITFCRKENCNLQAPSENVSILRQGYFGSLDDAVAWYKTESINFLSTSPAAEEWYPYLKEIPTKPYLTEIFSNYDTNTTSKLKLYRIEWAKYEEYTE